MIRKQQIFAMCLTCGNYLPLDMIYDGKKIISRSIKWAHDKGGIYCDDCAPSTVSALPGDPIDVIRNPQGREKAIIAALTNNLDGLTISDITRITGIRRTTINRRIAALENACFIYREGKKYFLKNDASLKINDACSIIIKSAC